MNKSHCNKTLAVILFAVILMLLAPQKAAADSELPCWTVSTPEQAADTVYRMGELATNLFAQAGNSDKKTYSFTATQSGFLHAVVRGFYNNAGGLGLGMMVRNQNGGIIPGRGGYCYYLTPGTYTVGVSLGNPLAVSEANYFFFFVPDTANAAQHKSKVVISQDKSSATVTLTSPDSAYVSYKYTSTPQKTGYQGSKLETPHDYWGKCGFRSVSGNSFTVKENGTYTVMVQWKNRLAYFEYYQRDDNKIYDDYENIFYVTVNGLKKTSSGGKSSTGANTTSVGTPRNVKAVLKAANQISLSWSAVPGARKYNIYQKKETGAFKKIKSTSKNSYTAGLLTAGKKYTYYVRAVDSKGQEGSRSENVSATTIGKVSNVKVEAYGSNSVTVKWSKAAGTSGYQISQTKSKLKENVAASPSSVDTSSILSAAPNVNYYYKIRAYQSVGGRKIYGKWSTVKAFTLNPYSNRLPASDSARKEIRVTVSYEEAGNKYSAAGTYSDSFFSDSVIDKNALIKISALAAASTYGNAISFLQQCKFEGVGKVYTGGSSVGTKKDNDHCTLYFGTKKVFFKDKAGKVSEKRIIAVIINGYSGDKYEWISNFNLGKDANTHEGFNNAASEAYKFLKKQYGSYLQNSIIWISGHSRGGAVTNLLAYKILRDYTDPLNTEVFAYGFATPNVSKSSKINATKRIVNVVNEGDFVPYVPLEEWGFDKPGKILDFTADRSKSLSPSEREDLIKIFNQCCVGSQAGFYKNKPSAGITGASIIGVKAHTYMSAGLAMLLNENSKNKASGLYVMTRYSTKDWLYSKLTLYFLDKEAINKKILGAHGMSTYLEYVSTLK